MIKCKAWNGRDLRGEWRVYRKLDGVRALRVGGRVVSRRGKPLYNLGRYAQAIRDCEVWLGDFERTIVAVRTQSSVHIPRIALYALDPPDPRLYLRTVENPTAILIRVLLKKHKRLGEDGLVLRQGATWLKVKHVETHDVRVLGVQAGTGKHRGRMGALLTVRGAVGTGFSDAQREAFMRRLPGPRNRKYWIVGQTVEVVCNELTPDGRLRHARFVRVREDK